MKNSFAFVASLALLSLSIACTSAEEGYQRPKVWPKPTDPPPASPEYHDVEEWIPTEEDIARSTREHNALLTEEVEQALTTKDIVRRENAFVFLVPELLQVEPQRLIDLHARLEPGAARDLLRKEMAENWSGSNPVAAARWMKSLEDDELRAAALDAITVLVPLEPAIAKSLAADLGLAQDATVRKLLAPLRAAQADSKPD